MTPERRAWFTRFLRMFMRDVRWLYRRRTGLPPVPATALAGAPRPCRSCAFNPGTDSARGFETTAKSLMEALTEQRPFFCHQGLPWRKPREEWTPDELQRALENARYCEGWAAIATFGPARDDDGALLARRAIRRAGPMP